MYTLLNKNISCLKLNLWWVDEMAFLRNSTIPSFQRAIQAVLCSTGCLSVEGAAVDAPVVEPCNRTLLLDSATPHIRSINH